MTLDKAVLSRKKGTGRLELCANLDVGGLTPPIDLVFQVVDAVSPLPVNVLVRPRGGDFVYNPHEVDLMLRTIDSCKAAGASGIVIGALTGRADVDMDLMRELILRARPLSVTFHRAFDETRDPLRSFEDIIALGCDRLLTSGHAANAWEGRELIAELVRRSQGRIVVMPGCGVRPDNISALAAFTGAGEFHGTALP